MASPRCSLRQHATFAADSGRGMRIFKPEGCAGQDLSVGRTWLQQLRAPWGPSIVVGDLSRERWNPRDSHFHQGS